MERWSKRYILDLCFKYLKLIELVLFSISIDFLHFQYTVLATFVQFYAEVFSIC